MNALENRKAAAVRVGALWMRYNLQLFFPNVVFANNQLALILGLMIGAAFSAAFFAKVGVVRKATVRSTLAAASKPVLMQLALLLPAFLVFWIMEIQGGWYPAMLPPAHVVVPMFTLPLTAIACGFIAYALFSKWPASLIVAPLLLFGCYFLNFVVSAALRLWFGSDVFIFIALLQIPVLFLTATVIMMRRQKAVARWFDRIGIAPNSAVMLRKEFRLQKNNILLAASAILVGIIGLYVIPMTAPTVGSFSVEDIRTAILCCFLIPTLVGILPLMVGCTAAASERAMDVTRWQMALPVTWRRVIGIKTVAIVILCVIIGGVIPYLLAILADSYKLFETFFRGTWTGWLALLMAAMGFYGGSIARNDYHGLLLALFPASVVFAGMIFADPYFQIFPLAVTLDQDFWKSLHLTLRLVFLAGLLVILASQLMRRQDQIRKSRLFIHGAILIIITFTATLINFTSERQVIREPLALNPNTQFRYNSHFNGSSFTNQISAGTVKDQRYQRVRLDLNQSDQVSRDFGTGYVIRDSRNRLDDTSHPFIASKFWVREFPQGFFGKVVRASEDQRWILTQQDKGRYGYTLCGPCNLAVASWMLPDSLFWRLSNVLDVKPLDADYQIAETQRSMLTTGTYVVSKLRPYKVDGYVEKRTSITLTDTWDKNTETTMTYQSLNSGTWPVIKLGDRSYLYAPFIDKGEVRIGSKVIGGDLSVNQGVNVIDLSTGKEIQHRFNNPISGSLLNEHWQNLYFPTQFCWHPSGAVAGYSVNYLTVLVPYRGIWSPDIKTIHETIAFDNWYTAVFAGPDAIAITNGSEIQMIGF